MKFTPEMRARMMEVASELATPQSYEVVVYDRRGEERFRSPGSGVCEAGVGRFTSHLAPGRDIDDAALCLVFDEGGTSLAWWKDMGCLPAGEPVVLGISFG